MSLSVGRAHPEREVMAVLRSVLVLGAATFTVLGCGGGFAADTDTHGGADAGGAETGGTGAGPG